MTTTTWPAEPLATGAPPRARSLGRTARWDLIFVVGGALLVPIPIVTYYALRAAGLSVGTCEDLVTLLVMVAVGGPHVFATYTRTYFSPGFRDRDAWLWRGGFVVAAIVLAAVVSSAFLDLTVAGHPPMRYVLTFFFFWAGVHVMHQHAYLAGCYAQSGRDGEARDGRPARDPMRWHETALMLVALFPIALFRMSMVDGDGGADPSAWATGIVRDSLGFGAAFADDYAFRIGRVAPLLPDLARHPAVWIGVTLLFATLATTWTVRCVRAARAGTLHGPRTLLVALATLVAFVVPLAPNLDTGLQGINAWHSFQYLGIAWLWNRHAFDRGVPMRRGIAAISAPGRGARFYLTGAGATLGLVAVIVVAALLLERFSGGAFVLTGHATPPTDPETGAVLYRPGSLLLAYYTFGFSLLLVHYLHDGFFFLRPKDLVR